jgi:hypothetical protein
LVLLNIEWRWLMHQLLVCLVLIIIATTPTGTAQVTLQSSRAPSLTGDRSSPSNASCGQGKDR